MSEQITFRPSRQPPVAGATLSVAVSQVVAVGGTTETLTANRTLRIAAPRYSLAPEAVQSVFPPAGHQGAFSMVLPHVVFNDPALPWQRSPEAPGTSPTVERPWLAILLFDAADPPPQTQNLTVADLTSSAGVFVPPRATAAWEHPTDPVTTIDIPVGLFSAIAPAPDDLRWLAHVRSLDSAEFSVVIGNRLPAEQSMRPGDGSVSTAHLVSLEGAVPYLPAADGTPSTSLPTSGIIRVPTLRSWTFTTEAPHESFDRLLLDAGTTASALGLPVGTGSTPNANADQVVRDALGMGYTALDHDLPAGSSTVSWYRGPLVPVNSNATASPPYQNADQLLRFDPTTGMLDVSYAAAWQLGRLLALRDNAFATALYRWKLTQAQASIAKLEQEVLHESLPPAVRTEELASPPDRFLSAVKGVVAPAIAAIASREEG